MAMFGVGTVAILYIAVNTALQFVMPASAVAGSPQPAATASVFIFRVKEPNAVCPYRT
jgi:amino acid transporter